jgi:O-antigen/teichoic acid export membrane protein
MFTTLAALWSLSPYIAAVVLPPAYRATAVFVIPLIALAGTVQALKSGVFDNIFHMYRRNWSQFISYFPAAIVTTVVAFLLVKPYGAVGAGLAAFSGMSAGLIGSILMTRKFARVHIDVREHAKILLIAGLSGLSGMVAAELCRRLGAVLDLTAGVLACVAVWTSLVFLLRPRSIAGGVQNAAKRLRGIGQRLFVGA